MIFLHEKNIAANLVRHWANASEDGADEEATYYILQTESGIKYADAIDIIPCKYTYEPTSEPIEQETQETTDQ